ncbi:MAG: hypothetical protein ACRC1P_00315 [Cellulosilyticaceae bacterium]
MQLYSNISNLSGDQFKTIISYLSGRCEKVSIYFPNDADADLLAFKNKFLQATDIFEGEDEIAGLEPKEGFSMVIASISEPVQDLLSEVKSSYHLSFGLIEGDQALLYVDDEGGIVVDSEKSLDLAHFASFTQA